jgi:hypothetical protein
MSQDLATLFIKVDSQGVVTASRDLDNLTGKSRKTEKATDSVTKGFSKLQAVVIALASSYALLKMTQYIKDATLLAARYETLGVVMRVVGNNAGYSGAQMDEFARGLQKAGIAMVESRNTLARMIQAQIDLDSSQKLARIAQDTAVIGHMNSSEAFEHMIYGLQTGHPRILRTIGLNVDFDASVRAVAVSLGVKKEALSEAQIMQGRVNAVIEAGILIEGSYEAAMETAGKQLLSLTRHFDNLKVLLGSLFTPALAEIIGFITGEIKDLNNDLEKNKEEWERWGNTIRLIIIKAEIEIESLLFGIDRIRTGTAAMGLLYATPGLLIEKLGLKGAGDHFRLFADKMIDATDSIVEHSKKVSSLEKKYKDLKLAMTPAGKLAAKQAKDALEATRLAVKAHVIKVKKEEKILKEWTEIQQAMGLTSVENELRLLDIKYKNFKKVAENEIELERWKQSQILEIQANAANRSIALYQELYESTGFEIYAEKAIVEYAKVLDAAEVTWRGILENEEDIAILRLKKEQEFADKLYGIFDDIVDAEQNTANERLRIIEDFTQDRIAQEEKATQRWSALEMARDPHMRGVGIAPGTVVSFYTGNKTRADAYIKMQEEQERTNVELQRIATSTARTNQLAQESAQREIQQIYEQRKREVTGQYDKLVDWLVGKQRASWGMTEWETHFGRVSEYAADLDPTEAGFYENGLNALENMVDVLFQIESVEQELLSEQRQINQNLLSSMTTIDDTILSLTTGAGAPVQNYETFQTAYAEKLAAAFESPENIGAFTSFIEQTFLPFMQEYGDTESYATVFDSVISSLESLKDMYGADWLGNTLTLAGLYEVDISDLVTYIGVIETYDVNLEEFYRIINQLESQGVDLEEFYRVTGALKKQEVDLAGFYELIGELPLTTAQWGQLIDIDFSGLWDSISEAIAAGEPLLDPAANKLNNLLLILGMDVPNAAQLVIDKMRVGSTFEQAFKDTVTSLGSLEPPLEGVGGAAEGTTGNATDLITELGRTLTPFDAVSLNLDTMSANVQTKLTETANFFAVLADSLGLTFTGEGGIAAAISSLTPTPLAPTVVATVETEASVYTPGTGQYYRYDHPAYIPPGVTTAHGYIIWSDGTRTYYGEGGLTDGPGIAGELGKEWVVPTYEPQRSNFLKDVGVDPDKIGAAIAKQLQGIGSGDITVSVNIDSREIGNVVAQQAKTNPDLQQSIRRLN